MNDKIYIRKVPRASGKTTEIISLAEILLELYKESRILLLFHNQPSLEYARKHFSDNVIFDKKYDYANRLMITSATKDVHFARGITFNYILIDELSLVSKECLQNLLPPLFQVKGTIYATDTL